MLRPGFGIAALVLNTGHAPAEEMHCEGPFAKDKDHKRLVVIWADEEASGDLLASTS